MWGMNHYLLLDLLIFILMKQILNTRGENKNLENEITRYARDNSTGEFCLYSQVFAKVIDHSTRKLDPIVGDSGSRKSISSHNLLLVEMMNLSIVILATISACIHLH